MVDTILWADQIGFGATDPMRVMAYHSVRALAPGKPFQQFFPID
jgi:hypothetical protein